MSLIASAPFLLWHSSRESVQWNTALDALRHWVCRMPIYSLPTVMIFTLIQWKWV